MGNKPSKSDKSKNKSKSQPKSNPKPKPKPDKGKRGPHSLNHENDNKKPKPKKIQNQNGPNRKASQAFSTGKQIVDKGFVKIDHFENIYRIEPIVDGAPNFRQAQGFYIFGGGQPTISAHHKIFDTFQSIGLHSVLWFNMRSEPVIYVNNMSYAPRDPEHPSENIHLPHDITITDVNDLSYALSKVVFRNATTNKDIFVYHKDTYALLPADRIDQTLEEPLNEKEYPTPVKSLMDLYNVYFKTFYTMKHNGNGNENNNSDNKENDNDNDNGNRFTVHCERLPVNDERAPDAKDVDRLVNIVLKRSKKDTALVFNCQMGKGRTTEGMIMAALIKKNSNEYYENLNKIMNDKCKDNNNDNNTVPWPTNIPEISSEASKDNKKFSDKNEIKELIEKESKDNGNYKIIFNLINLFTNKYKLNGKLIKNETDDIIDRCQHLQNIRTCIFFTKVRYIDEINEAQKNGDNNDRAEYWKRLSKNYLERYFVLICFNAYLHDTIAKGGLDNLHNVSYSEWMNQRSDINQTLGSYIDGPLSKFNWETDDGLMD